MLNAKTKTIEILQEISYKVVPNDNQKSSELSFQDKKNYDTVILELLNQKASASQHW